MWFAELVHAVTGTIAALCLVGFAPNIVHARDDVDRLYLLGGALLLTALIGNSVARFTEPPTYRQLLVLTAELAWIVAAVMSRRRRRVRLARRQQQ